jgi:4-hydroxy-3-polyprenylbenzoate decarboxylase
MQLHAHAMRSLRSSTSHLFNLAATATKSRSFHAVAHVSTASCLVRQHCTRPNTSTRTYDASKIASIRHHSLLFCPDQDSPVNRPKRIVVAITGATGAPYAIRLLEILRDLGVETHLVMSKWALATLKYETDLTEQQIRGLAIMNYTFKDMSAPPSSGSFQHDGMIIVPCSMKTLAAVRIGYCEDLIARSADVTLKEGRRLVMVVRETPLSDIHLENMLFLRRAGATIFPPVPAFYTKPQDLGDMVDQSVGRMLDCLGIHSDFFKRWNGFERSEPIAGVAYVS